MNRTLLHVLLLGILAAGLATAACARDAAQESEGANDGGTFVDSPGDAGTDTPGDTSPRDTGNTLTPDSDVPTQCTRIGDGCLLPAAQDVQIQNDSFVCIRNSDDSGDCHLRCDTPHDPEECRGVGGWCLDVGEDAPLPVCFFDQCALTDDCGADATCLRFRPNLGLCFFGGVAREGAYCDFSGDPAAGCAGGLVCDEVDEVCRRTCDPWGAGTCPTGTACGLFTNWTGACWPQTRTGRTAFEPCSPSYEYCNQNLLCAQIDPEPASPNCIPICQVQDPDSCSGYDIMGFEPHCVEVFDDVNGDLDTEVGFCLP